MTGDNHPAVNRRLFMGGLLAASFTLGSDARKLPPVVLGGVDLLPQSGKPTSMVVLLHGFGGNGASMRAVAQVMAKKMPQSVFVMPDAPEQCRDSNDPASRQWFGTRALDADVSQRAAQIARTTPLLNAHIDAKLAQYGLSDRALAIAGISQGAMMAIHAAPRRRVACAAVVAYNGMLIDAAGLQRAHIVRPPVLAVHGSQDTVVPSANLAVLARDLRAAGFAVETATYPLGHQVNHAGLMRGADFMRQQLAAQRKLPLLKRLFG